MDEAALPYLDAGPIMQGTLIRSNVLLEKKNPCRNAFRGGGWLKVDDLP